VTFVECIKSKIIVSDGAMGTTLQSRGLPSGHCPEEWNISHPEVLLSIHKDYFASGSDIVETNTFGGNRFRLKLHGYENKVYDFNKAAAKIAKSACPKNKFVAGSIGPSGEFLEPLGTLLISDLEEAFYEQIRGLVDGGVDALFIETMSYTDEIKAAISAAQKVDKNIPLVASMSFEKSASGYHTMMGVSIPDFIKEMDQFPVIAIGANCGKGAGEMIDIMEEFRQLTDKPLIAQANAGLPENKDGKIVYTETPEERSELTRVLLSEKVNIIGGCCGTTPDHIAAICKTVDYYIKRN
jgi:5-methyltetrahydrofolate--homocysteine methyltransferase